MVGKQAPFEFLREEVIAGMTSAQRLALATCVLAGAADDGLLSALGIDESAATIAAQVPLVDRNADGHTVPHSLWSNVVGQLVDDTTRTHLAVTIAEDRARMGAFDDALDLFADCGQWRDARALVLRLLRRGTSFLSAETARRWVDRFPTDQGDEPEILLLVGVAERLAHGIHHGEDFVNRALEGFRAGGNTLGEAAAISELTMRRWQEQDQDALLALYQRALELEPLVSGALTSFIRIVRAAMFDLAGETERALAELDSIEVDSEDPAIQAVVHNWRASLLVVAGDAAEGMLAARRGEDVSARFGGESKMARAVVTAWYAGDPTPAIEFLAAQGDFAAGQPHARPSSGRSTPRPSALRSVRRRPSR